MNHQNELSAEQLLQKAPKLTIVGQENQYRIEFQIYFPHHKQQALFLIITFDSLGEEQQLHFFDWITDQIHEHFRGMNFGAVFYNYGIADMDTLMRKAQGLVGSPEELWKNREKIKKQLFEIQQLSFWLQLHRLSDVVHSSLEGIDKIVTKTDSPEFDDVLNALNTLKIFIDLGKALFRYSRKSTDFGFFRSRELPYGMEESKYKELMTDFETLKVMVETLDEKKEYIREQLDQCILRLREMDNENLSSLFQRLVRIAMDLSFELEKSVQFSAQMDIVVNTNHYSQYYLSHFLINTLKYIVIEHIEIPKERILQKKNAVAKIELFIIDHQETAEGVFRDNGIEFLAEDIIQHAIAKQILREDVGHWMLENDRSNVYNLMLKPEFGPPVKAPPITLYRNYLSTILQEVHAIHGTMKFQSTENWNEISLIVPKKSNGIVIQPLPSDHFRLQEYDSHR